jgi:DNA-binding transcriptional LysR family regulator
MVGWAVSLVARNHHLAQRESVALSEAAAENWIVKSRHNDTYPLLTGACAAAGFAPRVTLQVKEWYAVSAFVAQGLGVCLLPRLVPLPSQHAVARNGSGSTAMNSSAGGGTATQTATPPRADTSCRLSGCAAP